MASGAARSGATLRFLGAAQTVTGSKFLIESGGAHIMVDCGLFQGLKSLRMRNWTHLPVPPSSIDAVILTHAHLDHSGYIPLLVHNGFRGEVISTQATRALSAIVLPDSGRLQEEEAWFANRSGYSKHRPARPIYTEEDAHVALRLFRPVPFGQPQEIATGAHATFRPAGHILGSATVSITIGEHRLLFSGDLGRAAHPLLLPPEPPVASDVVVVESTYGDRRHDDTGWLDRFAGAISRTASRGGSILIPAFAVDRTEEVLFTLRQLTERNAIPQLTVYVDSPMALSALEVYRHAIAAGDKELRPDLQAGAFDPGHLIEARTEEQSKAINHVRAPVIIVSASGMATGGRVLHHLARLLPDARNTVILPGYQAIGTRGRSLADGARTVKLLGQIIPVEAEVLMLEALSSHADSSEILDWLSRAPGAPGATYIVHGEPEASTALATTISERLRWNVVVPDHLQEVAL